MRVRRHCSLKRAALLSVAPTKPFTVARDGFLLHAAVAFRAHQRAHIEGLCRYGTSVGAECEASG